MALGAARGAFGSTAKVERQLVAEPYVALAPRAAQLAGSTRAWRWRRARRQCQRSATAVLRATRSQANERRRKESGSAAGGKRR